MFGNCSTVPLAVLAFQMRLEYDDSQYIPDSNESKQAYESMVYDFGKVSQATSIVRDLLTTINHENRTVAFLKSHFAPFIVWLRFHPIQQFSLHIARA
jgi:hypothetical protein